MAGLNDRVILVCALAASLLSFFACDPVSGRASIGATCGDFMVQSTVPAVVSREVAIRVGDSFVVSLCSNVTTGFSWSESAQISDPNLLQQTHHKVLSPEATGNRNPAPGASGEEVWTFKALSKGQGSLTLEYSRPWEGGEKGLWRFVAAVIVE